jgi:glutamyl-tRNA reductase
VEIIRDIRENSEHIANDILHKAEKQLAQGKSPEEALRFLARNLTNKLMHQPCTTLRHSGEQGRHDQLDYARQMFLQSDQPKPKKHK